MNDTTVAFAYLYRDGGNNKRCAAAVFANPNGMSLDEADHRLRAAFRDGQYFIPKRIGLESAAGDWAHDNELDHPWNEYFAGDLRATDHRPTDPRTLREFVEQVEAVAAGGWEETERRRRESRAKVVVYRVPIQDAIRWEAHKTTLNEMLLDKAEAALAEAITDYEQVEGRDFWRDHQLAVTIEGGDFTICLTPQRKTPALASKRSAPRKQSSVPRSGAIATQDILECAECGEPIDDNDDRESTYCGSMHRDCFAAHVEHCKVCRD